MEPNGDAHSAQGVSQTERLLRVILLFYLVSPIWLCLAPTLGVWARRSQNGRQSRNVMNTFGSRAEPEGEP